MVLPRRTPPSARRASFARALAFQRETIELIADEVTPIPGGSVIRTPSLPEVWALNQVRIERPTGFAEAVALADRHLHELPYRRLTVPEPMGGELEAEFRAAGWRVDCELTMAFAEEPDREVDTSAVLTPSGEAVLELLRRWAREGWDGRPEPEAERQLGRYWELEWRTRNARLLGISTREGSLAATTVLYSDGRAAQVESVYTVPEERGRGFARALVTRALELAAEGGHELTFIVADDHGWPKQLYARLGFEPVGRSWTFHR